jgi:hypothetical protein
MIPDKPLVYLLLGAAGSGRREVLADLLAEDVASGGRVVTLLAETETAGPFDASLGTVVRWRWTEGIIVVPEAVAADRMVFVTDGRRNPIDQIEAFKVWLEEIGSELARVICVVNCRWAEQHKELLVWYDACIHFADVVLLNHREGVANKWLSDFKARYQDQFYPCLFELVKGGRVKNPALILETEARRMSHFFDETDYIAVDEDDDEDEVAEGEEVEMKAEEDPYMERRSGGGHRVKDIPDVARLLSGA